MHCGVQWFCLPVVHLVVCFLDLGFAESPPDPKVKVQCAAHKACIQEVVKLSMGKKQLYNTKLDASKF